MKLQIKLIECLHPISFPTPTRFSLLKQNGYLCPHDAECANIAEFVDIADIFWEKNFEDMGSIFM